MKRSRIRVMSSIRSALATVAALLAITCQTIVSADDDQVTKAFQSLDANRDGRLSADEYLRRKGQPAMLLRDLQLFDFDGDQRLSLQEFSAVPGIGRASTRGPLPNPFEPLLEAAVAAMDETFGGWDRHPKQEIAFNTFRDAFRSSVGGDEARGLQIAVEQTDGNRNGFVSRDEAREFLERQLGLRSPPGEMLVQPNGRVVRWLRFPWLDVDQDGRITRENYIARVPNGGDLEFETGDADRDGVLDWAEFAAPEWPYACDDPVVWFLNADKDFDGLLDEQELAKATAEWRQAPMHLLIAPFDNDGDGKFTLEEFRLSPSGNHFCSWQAQRTDVSRDKRLSFGEFLLDKQNFLLLQRLYFSRLDRDGDGSLTTQEFPFHIKGTPGVYRMSLDGSATQEIWKDEAFPHSGSAEMSPDGTTILLDDYPRNQIMRIKVADHSAEDLLNGLMPSWSADGKRFAFSLSGAGVSITDADGGNKRVIDRNGWGAQWSPDGKSIAFTKAGGLWVYDVEANSSREVLPRTSHPYSSLYFGMGWSPDSRWIAIKAGSSDIIRVDTQSPEPTFKLLFKATASLAHPMAWSPDGKRILFLTRSKEYDRMLPHEIDAEAGGEARLVDGIEVQRHYTDVHFSPDGKWLVMIVE